MPIVTRCSVAGCETLTIGPVCVVHEAKTTRVFVRGRPFVCTLEAARPVGMNIELPVRALLPRPSASLAGVGLDVEPR